MTADIICLPISFSPYLRTIGRFALPNAIICAHVADDGAAFSLSHYSNVKCIYKTEKVLCFDYADADEYYQNKSVFSVSPLVFPPEITSFHSIDLQEYIKHQLLQHRYVVLTTDSKKSGLFSADATTLQRELLVYGYDNSRKAFFAYSGYTPPFAEHLFLPYAELPLLFPSFEVRLYVLEINVSVDFKTTNSAVLQALRDCRSVACNTETEKFGTAALSAVNRSLPLLDLAQQSIYLQKISEFFNLQLLRLKYVSKNDRTPAVMQLQTLLDLFGTALCEYNQSKSHTALTKIRSIIEQFIAFDPLA